MLRGVLSPPLPLGKGSDGRAVCHLSNYGRPSKKQVANATGAAVQPKASVAAFVEHCADNCATEKSERVTADAPGN